MSEQKKKLKKAGKKFLLSSIDLTLNCLIAVSSGVCFLGEHPYRQSIIIRDGWEGLVKYDRKKARKAVEARLRDLKHRKLIETQRTGNRLIYVLTASGRLHLLRAQIKNASKLSDGRQVRVEYDIPRSQNSARDALRYFLKHHGFHKVQQSVWVCERDVYESLCEFVRSYNLEDWVDVVAGESMSSTRKNKQK